MDDHDLHRRFTYHRPRGTTPRQHAQLRAQALDFARLINSLCPDGVEKRVAVDRLEESVMWANAAIACAPAGEELTP